MKNTLNTEFVDAVGMLQKKVNHRSKAVTILKQSINNFAK